jgi:Cu+-exporting ATPase
VALEPAGGERAAALALATAVQKGSEHPLARAVLAVAVAEEVRVPEASSARAVPGRGMQAQVGGRTLALGSTRWMAELGVDLAGFSSRREALEKEGLTVSWLAETAPARHAIALLALGDAVKPEAAEAIRALEARGIATAMISGDSRAAAEAIAARIGIREVHAEVLPADKAGVIARLRQGRGVVAMVGDGVNDAPALAAADIGFAMGSGTDAAMHAAGVTLMRGDPRLVAAAVEISRRTYAKIRQNLFWAFFYNVVGIPLAALGYLSPVVAGAAMALSSVSVVTNALLLKRWKPEGQGDAWK